MRTWSPLILAVSLAGALTSSASAQIAGQGRGGYGTLLTHIEPHSYYILPGSDLEIRVVHLNTTDQDQRPVLTCPIEFDGVAFLDLESACDIPETIVPGDSAWTRVRGRAPTEPGRYQYEFSHGAGRSGFTFELNDDESRVATGQSEYAFVTGVVVEETVDRLTRGQLEALLGSAFFFSGVTNIPAADSARARLSERYPELVVRLVPGDATGLTLKICPKFGGYGRLEDRCQRESSVPVDGDDLMLGSEITARLITSLAEYVDALNRIGAR